MRRPAPPTGSTLLLLCAVLLTCGRLGSACASPLSAGAGVDRQAGPGHQTYTAGLLFGTVSVPLADATLALIRYDDSVTGYGNALFANAGVGVPGLARIRAIGARSFGDGGYRAWKLRAGPEWSLGLVTAGVYGLHQEDNVSARLNAVGVEVGTSVVPGLALQAGGMAGKREGDANASQASGSFVWGALSHVQILGELDVGRGVASSTTSTSGGGPLHRLSLAGGLGAGSPGERTVTDTRVETVGLLGVRFLIP